MAAPDYSTDLITIADCSTATGWTEIGTYTLGGTPETDIDYFIYGTTNSITQECRKDGVMSMAYDNGSAITLPTDGVFTIWWKFLAPNALETYALNGARFVVGSSTTAFEEFTIQGSDTYPYGGWLNLALNPPSQTADVTVGSPTGDYNVIGMTILISAISKGNPHGVDILRYGRAESQYTLGESATPATFNGYSLVNDDVNARWGLLQDVGGSYLFKGLMSLGLTGTAVYMADANVNISIDNTRRVSSSFNAIEINNAASEIYWTNVSFTSLCLVSKGTFEMIDNATLVDIGGAFTDMGTFIYQSNATLTGRTWRRCDQVTQGGAAFDACVIEASTGTYALSADAPDDITNAVLSDNATAMYIPATVTGPISFDGHTFSGNTTDVYWAGTVGTLIINLVNGANPTTSATAGGTIEFVTAPVDAIMNVIDETGAAVNTASIAMYAAAGGSLPFNVGVTIVNAGTLATVTHGAAHNMVTGDKVVIKGATEVYNRGVFTITVTSATTYTYTMLGTPAGDPTGSLATWTAMYESLGATNTFTKQRTYTTNQPVTGWARKSSSSPYYKTGVVAGTIDKDTGGTFTALMLSDE